MTACFYTTSPTQANSLRAAILAEGAVARIAGDDATRVEVAGLRHFIQSAVSVSMFPKGGSGMAFVMTSPYEIDRISCFDLA